MSSEEEYIPEEYRNLKTLDGKAIAIWKERNDWTVGIQGTSFWVGVDTREGALNLVKELSRMTSYEAIKRWL